MERFNDYRSITKTWRCEERMKDLVRRAVWSNDSPQFSIVSTHVQDSGSIRMSPASLPGKERCPNLSDFFPDLSCLYLDIILLNSIFKTRWCAHSEFQIRDVEVHPWDSGRLSEEKCYKMCQCGFVTNNPRCLFCCGQSSPAKAAASSPSSEGGSVTATPSVKSSASAVPIMQLSVKKVRTVAPASAAQHSQPRTHVGLSGV